jgi:hypothetical protein
MSSLFSRLFGPQIDAETLFALRYKLPSRVELDIREDSDGGYTARVLNLDGNVITQGSDGLELFEMVNDAVLGALDIPEQYRVFLPNFLPPEEVRRGLKIPDSYLNKKVELLKTA